MNSFSLYLHIPFCVKKCRYCDFYSVRYESSAADYYLTACAREIGLYQKKFPADETILSNVYIGGGTPTALTATQLQRLCGLIRSAFPLASGYEWTVECNPESFTHEKKSVLLDAGVTRLTFGFQSLNDRELSLLGRIHTAGRCREILSDPALSRFFSVGVDCMYGLPGQTIASLEQTLMPVFDSPHIRHISAYELTIAEKTPFGRHRSMLPLPAEKAMSAMTTHLWSLLAEHGFEQYEVSNFAQSGHECRHNEAYWDHEPYLGVGCAAHSYLNGKRWANVRDIGRYIDMVDRGIFPHEFTETIDAQKLGTEMVFLGLRRTKGINEEVFRERCGMLFADFVRRDVLDDLVQQGLLCYEKPFWKPAGTGLLMADSITGKLL